MYHPESSCKTCVFYAVNEPHEDLEEGECHRYPPVFDPTANTIVVEGEDFKWPNDPDVWLFPAVYAYSSWCGEYVQIQEVQT